MKDVTNIVDCSNTPFFVQTPTSLVSWQTAVFLVGRGLCHIDMPTCSVVSHNQLLQCNLFISNGETKNVLYGLWL